MMMIIQSNVINVTAKASIYHFHDLTMLLTEVLSNMYSHKVILMSLVTYTTRSHYVCIKIRKDTSSSYSTAAKFKIFLSIHSKKHTHRHGPRHA